MKEDMAIFKFALREDVKNEPAFLPAQAEPLATGYDVRACPPNRKDIVLRAGQYFKIPLGFRCFIPDGWWYKLHPRSSSFAKKNIHSLIGVIDEAFCLEAVWAGQYLPDVSALANDLVIKFGDPIGQIIPVRREVMTIQSITNDEYDKLCKQRGATRTGGFGSTDKK